MLSRATLGCPRMISSAEHRDMFAHGTLSGPTARPFVHWRPRNGAFLCRVRRQAKIRLIAERFRLTFSNHCLDGLADAFAVVSSVISVPLCFKREHRACTDKGQIQPWKILTQRRRVSEADACGRRCGDAGQFERTACRNRARTEDFDFKSRVIECFTSRLCSAITFLCSLCMSRNPCKSTVRDDCQRPWKF